MGEENELHACVLDVRDRLSFQAAETPCVNNPYKQSQNFVRTWLSIRKTDNTAVGQSRAYGVVGTSGTLEVTVAAHAARGERRLANCCETCTVRHDAGSVVKDGVCYGPQEKHGSIQAHRDGFTICAQEKTAVGAEKKDLI